MTKNMQWKATILKSLAENIRRRDMNAVVYRDYETIRILNEVAADLVTPPAPSQDRERALNKFNALWFSIKKHMGIDPECKHWAEEIRNAIITPLVAHAPCEKKNTIDNLIDEDVLARITPKSVGDV